MRRDAYQHVENVTEHPIPSKMQEDTLYLESAPDMADDPYYIFFLCPCGCQTLVALPLENKTKQHHTITWQITSTDPVTLSPSIQQLDGCKSHYFIQSNRVKWC